MCSVRRAPCAATRPACSGVRGGERVRMERDDAAGLPVAMHLEARASKRVSEVLRRHGSMQSMGSGDGSGDSGGGGGGGSRAAPWPLEVVRRFTSSIVRMVSCQRLGDLSPLMLSILPRPARDLRWGADTGRQSRCSSCKRAPCSPSPRSRPRASRRPNRFSRIVTRCGGFARRAEGTCCPLALLPHSGCPRSI